MTPHSRSGLLAGLFLSAFLQAQHQHEIVPADEASATRLSPAAAATSGIGLGILDGTIWARGATYRAGFTASAVEVTPLLGVDAPRSMPLTLRFAGIRRGGAEVQATAASPVMRDDRVEYDRGPGIVERYVVREDGLKQSFVFARPVRGTGDLVVRFELVTEMTPDATGPVDALSFRAGELGGIDVGAVIGIDSAGARVTGRMALAGGHLDLVLPAAFVDAASYPLELDPLIGGVINTGRSFSDAEPDVAYDETNDVYLVVYTSVASSADRDVFGQFVTGSGVRQGNTIPIAVNGHRSDHPSVGNCNIRDEFLVCWHDNGAGNFDVLGVAVDAATGAVSPVANIATGSSGQVTPDVGGDSFEIGGSGSLGFCVVTWDDQTNGLYAGVVNMRATGPMLSTPIQVTNGADPLRNNPAITKDGGDFGNWFIAFEWDHQNMAVACIDFFGNLVVQPTNVAQSLTQFIGNPDIAGDGGEFKFAYERDEAGNPSRHDIYIGHGRLSSGAIQVLARGPLEDDPNEDERDPQIANLGPVYLAGWVNPRSGGTRVELTNIVAGGIARCGSEQLIDAAGQAYSQPAITGRRESGDDNNDEGLVTFRNFGVGPGQALLESRRWTPRVGGPVTTIAPGCGVGGTCGTDGPAALGNVDFKITLTGADPSTPFAIWFADVLQQPVQTCGPCTSIGVLTQSFVLANGGQADIRIALPCDASFLGLGIDSQWVTLSQAQQPCPTFAELQFSSAIRIVLAD